MKFMAIPAALRTRAPQFYQVMKLTTLLLVIALVQASAKSYSQQITLHETNASFTKVISSLEKQSGYVFIYTDQGLKKQKFSVQLTNASLEQALTALFERNEITYALEGKNVFLKRSEEKAVPKTSVQLPPITVNGTVMDENNRPFPSVTVTVKGTNNQTITDTKGHFTLTNVDDKASLVFTFVGYKPKELPVKASMGEIQLEVLQSELQEVNVAYGKTTLQANTSAITVISGAQIQTLPNRSFDKSLQGLVPGLLVTSGSGQPGGLPSNFVLRGIASGGQPSFNGDTYRNPLIVIDGVPVSQEPITEVGYRLQRVTNPMAQLNPSDIESISVLKDAAAVALYGSKASNGVILVTTKRGKAGTTQYTVRHQTDFASPLNGKIKMLNQQEYLTLLYEAYKNTDASVWTDAAILADLKTKFPTRPDGSFYSQDDWNSGLFNKTGITVANEFSMSGGNEKSNFYLNLEYTDQKGVAKNTGYKRKSMRFNYEHRPASWIKLGINTSLSHNLQNYSDADGYNFSTASTISPLNPIRDNVGNFIPTYEWGHNRSAGTREYNPIAGLERNKNASEAYRSLSRLSGEVSFLKYFTFNSILGADVMFNEASEKFHPSLDVTGNLGYLQEQNFRTTNIISTNTIRFIKKFGSLHDINFLAGQEAQIKNQKFTEIKRENLSANPDEDQLQTGTITAAVGGRSKQTLLSYFSQLNYSFSGRYLLSGSIRRDGSSLFGDKSRFGTYWSVGSGWVVSSEPFMHNLNKIITFLKFRGSVGQSGNSAAIWDKLRFDRLQRIQIAGQTAVVPAAGNPGNPHIKWESTFTWDLGMDLRLWNDRVALTADIYNRKTSNLIAYNINAAFTSGYTAFTDNIGDLQNKGIELSLSLQLIKAKEFKWNATVNWSKNRNVLVKAFFPSSMVFGTNLANNVGAEYNSFYLPEWAGVNPQNGRPLWIDSTGTPNENYYAAKPKIVGKAQPDGFGSLSQLFSYKNFDLSVDVYYQYGSEIYLNSSLQDDGYNPYLNQTIQALDRWQRAKFLNKTDCIGANDICCSEVLLLQIP